MRTIRPLAATVGAAAAVLIMSGCTGSGDGTSGSAAVEPSGAPSAAVSTSGAAPSTSSDTVSPSSTKPSARPPKSAAIPTKAPFPTQGREPSKRVDQASVLKSLPGATTSACVTVGSHSDIRSGSIAAGNFQTARKQYAADVNHTETPQLNLYVIPQDATGMRELTVKIDPLGVGTTTTATSKQVEDADQWSYFALVLPIREPGAYRLLMVAGSNRGCFDVSFSK
jgi:hypothetical protein